MNTDPKIMTDAEFFQDQLEQASTEVKALVNKLAATERQKDELHAHVKMLREVLELVWNDKRVRFSTLHRGLPIETVIRNALMNNKI